MKSLSWMLWAVMVGSCSGQYPRQYHLWSSSEIHSTIVQWGKDYPQLIRVNTSQTAFGLSSAGQASDCPFDGSDVGCLNYFGIIQDFVAHPLGSASSNLLPTVLLSGALHGDERVGPTAVMEAAKLLLQAAACQANGGSQCQLDLQNQGMTNKQRQWLARLVTSRRILIVPTANSLGYYRIDRNEDYVDPNRDFPFDPSSTSCMTTIAARTLNELFRDNIIQFSITFHAGTDVIGYEWGAFPYWDIPKSPDDVAQAQLAEGFSRFGGAWSGQRSYPTGTINDVVYPVQGGMEDWAYAGSWDTTFVPKCKPSTYGGYPTSKTTYNEATLRVFNMLVETSTDKIPASSKLGTSKDVLDKNTSGNGHVSRNIRLAMAAIDLVEPYLSIVGVDAASIVGDFAPLKRPSCDTLPSIVVGADTKKVTIYWTVGGAIEIDETRVWVANAKNVDLTILQGCAKQPITTAIMQAFTGGSTSTGVGFLAEGGPNPAHSSTVGPRFSATIDLPLVNGSDEFLVLVSARVDSSWASEPSTFAPDLPPQSHLANVRTNPSWKHVNANKVVQGRLNWFSVPIRIIRAPNSPAFPTPAPVTSSSPSPPAICFSGDCEVDVKNKGVVKMSDLTVGDFVKVAPNKYEPVYSFGHRNEYESTEFLQIATEGDRKPLEISKDHMVKNQDGQSVPASMVKLGDLLIATSGDLVRVTGIRKVVRRGVYAPFTESGFVIVNDIAASNYIAFHESAFLKVGGTETSLTYQWLAHTFNSAHRVAVRMGITRETYTAAGISRWVDLPHRYSSWVLHQHVVVAWSILVPSIVLFAGIAMFEKLLTSSISLVTIAILVALLVTHRIFRLRMTKTR